MFKFAEDAYLLMNGFFEVRIFLNSFEVNLLDGYFLLGCVLVPLENFAKRSFSQTFLSEVAVFADSLDCSFLHFKLLELNNLKFKYPYDRGELLRNQIQ